MADIHSNVYECGQIVSLSRFCYTCSYHSFAFFMPPSLSLSNPQFLSPLLSRSLLSILNMSLSISFFLSSPPLSLSLSLSLSDYFLIGSGFQTFNTCWSISVHLPHAPPLLLSVTSSANVDTNTQNKQL